MIDIESERRCILLVFFSYLHTIVRVLVLFKCVFIDYSRCLHCMVYYGYISPELVLW